MRVFKNRSFSRYARKQGIDDADLCQAIDRAERGQIDADLGGGVLKQRVARQHEGKSGGFRTIVLIRSGDRAFFAYGFAKNRRDNIRQDELRAFKELAALLLGFSDAELIVALETGALIEVKCDEQDV